jgi:hypothetical protein
MILDREYDDNSYNNKLQKEEQIPTEYNQEKTLRWSHSKTEPYTRGRKKKQDY